MKKVLYGKEATEGLKQGLDIVANAVKVTMGAKGLPVAIDNPYSEPTVTKDGVSVASAIHLEDPLLNMGANMVISAAKKANEESGDGSTTATVLTQAIVHKGIEHISEGASFYEVKKGMEFAVEKIIERLKYNSTSIKDNFEKLKSIAIVSANNDQESGELIVKTFTETGEHGFISVQESNSNKTYVEHSKGLKFKMAPENIFMFKDTVKKYSEIDNSKVLLYIGRIDAEEELLPALEEANKTKKNHLLVVCTEISPLLLNRVVSAKLNGSIDITIMQCPEFGIYREQAMEDIALVCGARLFTAEKDDDIKNVTEEELGSISKLIITEETTSFISKENSETVDKHINNLLEKLSNTDDTIDVRDLKERIARLKGGVAKIFVGAQSKMEMKEKKDRIEDAVNALTIAYKEGVVAGGGVALLNATKKELKGKFSEDFKKGIDIIYKAVEAPAKQILENAYKSEEFETLKTKSKNIGYNVITDRYCNMLDSGILDPLMVTVNALRNALSVSAVFLSTQCILLDVTNYTTKDIKFADGI